MSVGFDEDVAGVDCWAVEGGGLAGAAFCVCGTVATVRYAMKREDDSRSDERAARRQAEQMAIVREVG